MDMNLRKLWELLEARGVWCAAVHGITKSQTQLSDWTTTLKEIISEIYLDLISRQWKAEFKTFVLHKLPSN